MPKCGDFGHLKKDGQPCGFIIPEGARICAFHSRTPQQRRELALKGSFNASLKAALPDDFEIGELSTPEDMKAFLRKMLPHVLKKPMERWRSAEARGWFGFLVELDRNRVQEKLADAVLAVQHGGQSLILLQQFLDGAADSRRKLPSRVKPVPMESEISS